MKLVLIGDDGTVVDSTDDLWLHELRNLSPAGALALISELVPPSPPEFGA